MQILRKYNRSNWYFYTFLFSCFFHLNGFTQAPFFHSFDLNTKQSNFNSVFEDNNGRIYFGTSKGLLFFDGQEAHRITTLPDTNIAVTTIFQTSNNQLLVGCDNGFIYVKESQTLVPLNPEEGYPQVSITGFSEDDSGNLWFSTYGEGVFFFHKNRMYNINEDDGLSGNDIYTIAKGSNGEVWLGTDGGISICSFKGDKKQIRNFTRQDGLPDEIVQTIYTDHQGHHWIGMYDNGICRINSKTNQIDFTIKDWSHGIVNCIELFENKELWIGTNGNGIYRYLIAEDMLSPVEGSINYSKSKIQDLLKDTEGNIWVLDNKYKVSNANKQFEILDLPLENIQSLLADNENKIWVGTETGLFIKDQYQSKIITEILKKKDLNVTSLFQDKFHNIWIGTFGKGIYLYHEATKTLKHFSEKDGLTNNSVLSISGINGHIWLATLGGVTEVALTDNPIQQKKLVTRNFNKNNGLGTNFIYTVFVDRKARIWFGTDGKGLSVLQNGGIENHDEATIINKQDTTIVSIKTIYSICEDHLGNIWFSTAKEGVLMFDGQHFQRLPSKEDEEVNDKVITSMIRDDNNNILLIHTGGIDLLNPVTKHLIYYDVEVGLKNIDPNLNAIASDQTGNIWIADQSQLIKYTALHETLEIHPRTILTDLKVNYQSKKLNNLGKLDHDQNNIVFHYSGLWYTAPTKVKYKYRLKGYDPNWIYSKDNQVSYSSLPAGDYTFEVTSTENDSFHDEIICTYSFAISKPFWLRTWFILLCFTLVLATIYWYIKSRDIRKQRVNELQKEMLASQLAALKAQINPHFLFNSFNTLTTLIEEDQSAAVEYVERLSDFYRSMLQYRNVNVIPLQEEIELVKDYTFLLKKRFGDNFNIHVNINGTIAYLAPLSLQTLVENAVKHNVISKSKPLTVNIELQGNEYIFVSNNLQKKIHPEESTGFGLQSLIRRYELLSNKKIKINTSDTQFTIGLPLIK